MSDITLRVPATYQPLTIPLGVRCAARRTPGKVALIEAGRTRSYAELCERMTTLHWLALGDLELGFGDHVAIIAPNCIEYLELVLGLSEIGIASATLSHRLSGPELRDICDDACAKVLFAHESCRAAVDAAQLDGRVRVIWIGADLEARLAAAQPLTPPRYAGEWDIFCIPYTSGTTGRPKGVLLSHRARALAFNLFAIEYGCFGPDDRFLAIAPLAHGAGMAFALAPIFTGGCCELLPRFDAGTVVRKLGAEAFTGVFLVPTQFHAIFSLPEETLQASRHTRLKAMISNAAALPQAIKEKIIALWGEGLLHETYGSTEIGLATNLRPADQLRKQQCVGLPFATTQVRLLDDDGREVEPGEVGELFTLCPLMFSGYWQNGARQAPELRDGWFSAGDLARRDDEGYVYIVDRKKDMVVTGGINVYPRQIEELLYRHPAIRECAVVGMPDPRWGERLKGFIALREGCALTPEELIEFLTPQLSAYKVPRDYAFVAELPKNPAGKILKRALRESPESSAAAS
ncbi:MAG: AMP-binding protein [Steroidobacteraceae bacterium]